MILNFLLSFLFLSGLFIAFTTLSFYIFADSKEGFRLCQNTAQYVGRYEIMKKKIIKQIKICTHLETSQYLTIESWPPLTSMPSPVSASTILSCNVSTLHQAHMGGGNAYYSEPIISCELFKASYLNASSFNKIAKSCKEKQWVKERDIEKRNMEKKVFLSLPLFMQAHVTLTACSARWKSWPASCHDRDILCCHRNTRNSPGCSWAPLLRWTGWPRWPSGIFQSQPTTSARSDIREKTRDTKLLPVILIFFFPTQYDKEF